MRVCLDAGHFGKYNRSPVVSTYFESVIMWKLTELQAMYLESYGIEVVKTRDVQEKDLELTTRGKKAKGCDLFISNHSNATGSSTVNYVLAIGFRPDSMTGVDERSMELAAIMAKTIGNVMGLSYKTASKGSGIDRNRDGILNDEYYGVLHGAKSVGVPGVILEHSFHTNKMAAMWLMDDNNLNTLARAEAAAIAKYLGVDTNTAKPVQMYRVRKSWADAKSQIGAFKSLDRAIAVCEVGYSVFDSEGNVVYTNGDNVPNQPSQDIGYKVVVTASSLNVREGAGTSYRITKSVKKGEVFTIVEEKSNGSTKWGKLMSGAGWISLKYTERI